MPSKIPPFKADVVGSLLRPPAIHDARAARDRGYPVQLVTGTTLASEEFGLLAGPRPKECSS